MREKRISPVERLAPSVILFDSFDRPSEKPFGGDQLIATYDHLKAILSKYHILREQRAGWEIWTRRVADQ
jgi:hypothetical protein